MMRKFFSCSVCYKVHLQYPIVLYISRICFVDSRTVLEPAGALGVAGLHKYVQEHGITGQTLAATTSGANMDFDSLDFVCSRSKGD
jgi:threonine dehydratase